MQLLFCLKKRAQNDNNKIVAGPCYQHLPATKFLLQNRSIVVFYYSASYVGSIIYNTITYFVLPTVAINNFGAKFTLATITSNSFVATIKLGHKLNKYLCNVVYPEEISSWLIRKWFF